MSATVLSSLTNTISGIKFQTINDIPNLQLWLDASDNNTIRSSSFSPSYAWGFNGINDFITISDSTELEFSSGSFTIECWIKFNSNTGSQNWISNYSGASNGWTLQVFNGIAYCYFSGNGVDISGTTILSPNTWHHLAVSGSTGSYKLFVNGIQEGSTFTGAVNFNGGDTNIGRSPTATSYLNGYISNLRIINGKALYTTDFNPSISAAVPLQPISEPGVTTPLLALQDPTVTQNNGNVPGITLTSSGTFTSISDSVISVSQWLDKSPNALTASQPIINNQSTLLSAEINGLNVIDFDGTDDHFNLSAPISLSGDYSHFFVYRRSDVTPVNISLGNKATGVQSSYRHHSDNFVYSGNERTNSTVVSATTLVGGVRKNDYLQIDLESKPFSTAWSSSVTNQVSALGVYNNTSYQKGPMCEIIHTGSLLPNQEIDLVNRKLFDKWKVPKQVPFLRTAPILSTGTSTSAISSTMGTWYVEPTSYRVEWIRSLDNVNFTTIINTLSSYTNPLAISVYNPTPSDYGYFIKTSVSATNSFGTGVF